MITSVACLPASTRRCRQCQRLVTLLHRDVAQLEVAEPKIFVAAGMRDRHATGSILKTKTKGIVLTRLKNVVHAASTPCCSAVFQRLVREGVSKRPRDRAWA